MISFEVFAEVDRTPPRARVFDKSGSLSFATTPQEAILTRVTCYAASLYVIDFIRALNLGEAQGKMAATITERTVHALEIVKEEEIAAPIDVVFETIFEQIRTQE